MTYEQEILEVLRSKKVVPCYELVKVSHRFSMPIMNLRRKGYCINTYKEWVGGKMHTSYELVEGK